MKKNIVVISNLYPNRNEPNRGVFIRQLVEELAERYNITVVCPRPWRPKLMSFLGSENVGLSEDNISGINVLYPQHLVIPKIMRFTYGFFMSLCLSPIIKSLHKDRHIDLISAHWVYPDGYGAVIAGNKLEIPVVMHALGCDINEYSKYRLRRIMISKAVKLCDQIIVKSQDLAIKVEQLGSSSSKISTILNGVDQDRFYKVDIKQARESLGLCAELEYLLFIGNIQEEKGLEYLIRALSLIDNFNGKLLIVGSGPLEESIRLLSIELNLSGCVEFIGQVPHNRIPVYLNAVNALCLPSLREGCPNIVLESLSCGTPVLATNVGAVSQIITHKEHGIIVSPQSVIELSSEIPKILNLKNKSMINFDWYSWKENANKVSSVFDKVIEQYTNNKSL